MDTLLVIGATSKVGTTLVPAALKTRSVRVATRTPDGPTARQLAEAGAEVVAMDLRDRRSIDAACVGVGQVVLSAHAFGGKGDNNTQTVDRDGQQSCIEAAKAAGLQRVVLVSVVGASPDAPMALFRAKWQTEQALAASGMQWTSVRATAFMETWASLLGTPVLAGKRALVFGRGDNPINFVSATDVAALVLAVLDDPRSFGRNIEIGGLENLTMNEVVARFGAAVGATPRVRHVPIGLMRAARGTVGRFAKPVGEQLTAGISMATAPLTFNPTSTLAEWPVPSTNLDAVIARMALQRNI